jgi:hypothetical protein
MVDDQRGTNIRAVDELTLWAPLTDSPIGELAMLRRMGMVDEFSKCFIMLSSRDTTTAPQNFEFWNVIKIR